MYHPVQSQVVMSIFVVGVILLFYGLSMVSRKIALQEIPFSELSVAAARIFPIICVVNGNMNM